MKQKNNNLWIVLVVALLAGGVGFLGGFQYEKNRQPVFANRNGQYIGMMGGGVGGRNGAGQMGQNRFRPIVGEIATKDETSITVKSQDGSSKIVLLTTSTAIEKTESGTNADIAVGKNVRILGTENTDGSVTAQDIQLNPIMRNITSAPNR